MKQRNKIVIGCMIALVIALILGLVSCHAGNQAGKQENTGTNVTERDGDKNGTGSGSDAMSSENGQKEENKGDRDSKDTSGMCRITISNGASSANTSSAVNGLHVYCSDTTVNPDLDDYVSGAEVPVGTPVTVFVYNLASDVHLTIYHNGQLLVDKDYDIRQAWVDDDTVEYFDITLEGDLEVVTTAGKNRVAEDDARIDDPGTENEPVKTTDTYKVTIENRIGGSDVEMNVRYVDDSGTAPRAVDIRSGDKLPANTGVFCQVINRSAWSVRATAYVDGKVIDAAVIGPKPAGQDASYGGLVGDDPTQGMKLTGNMTIVLDDPNSGYTPTPDPKPEPEPDPKPEPEPEPEEKLATITIHDGAKSANTDSYVNGLHVYNPDSEDLDDLASGAKLPLGTRLSIYEYNLASPVRLQVVHNGKLIKDETYPVREAWVDDDKIEFIELTLEGDVEITTSVAEEPVKNYTVKLTGDLTDQVVAYLDGNTLKDGMEITAGAHSFYVYNENMDDAIADGVVTLTVNGKQVGESLAVGDGPWAPAEFENVMVDGDVVIDVSMPTAKTYTVTVDDQVKSDDVTLNVRWVDFSGGQPQQKDIVAGEAYPEGTGVYCQVVNKSDKQLKLTAKIGAEVIGETVIEAKPVDDDASYGGLMGEDYMGLALTGNMVITLEEVKAEDDLCLITIDDGAASANTSSAVNGLHVYCSDTAVNPNLDDYVSGDKAPVGTPVSIYVYNRATPVHLTVIHNGETVVDKDYPEITSDSDVDFIELTLEGDLTVITSVATMEEQEGRSKLHINDETLGWVYIGWTDYHDGAVLENDTYDFTVYSNDTDIDVTVKVGDRVVGRATVAGGTNSHDFTDVQVDDDVYFIFTESGTEPETETYTITIDDRIHSDDVDLNVRWLDSNMDIHDVHSGEAYPKDLEIFTQLINRSDRSVKVTAYAGDTVLGTTTLAPKPVDDDASYGGLPVITLAADVVYVLEYADSKPEPETVTVHIECDMAWVYYQGWTELQDGQTLDKGTYDFHVMNGDVDVELIVKVGDRVIAQQPLGIYDVADFEGVEVDDDIYFIFQAIE